MFTQDQIEKYLAALNDWLTNNNVTGELCLYGGAVMSLVYQARPATKDVDAIFQPTAIMRQAIAAVAEQHQLPVDWLNDAVKGFVVAHPKHILFDFSHLKIYTPAPDYLLAMKVMAARVDTADRDDVIRLIRELQLATPQAVFAIVEHYYPRKQIKPAAQFFIQELFDANA